MDLPQKTEAANDRAPMAMEAATAPALSRVEPRKQTLPAAPRSDQPILPSFPSTHPRRDLERDSYASTAFADLIDRSLHAAIARFTGGLSPAALMAAHLDWLTHLAFSPGKQMRLTEKAIRKAVRFGTHASHCAFREDSGTACIEPLPQDKRFAGEAWRRWPYNLIYQAFLLHQQWWHNATTEVRGVTEQHERVVTFMARQILDMISPSNFLLTNPEVLNRTVKEAGLNLARGLENFAEDWERLLNGKKAAGLEPFRAGRNLAVTPGKVIYRNRLIELMQYAPATDKIRTEPVLIVPAWIMKFYILDLSPHNSLVKYLTDQGFTVFMISWKNPGPEDRDLGMDDYRKLGVLAALEAVAAVVPERKIHAVGYCIGGTLLALTAAGLARDADARLKSITLFAAQTDFTEAGELMLFINESQLALLEDVMWEQGFLNTAQMAGTFQMLRSGDLIWSRMVRDYLMGERQPVSDLMAWNADATRMPYRMHSEYLRHFFLDNDLATGRCKLDGKPVALTDIRAPIFAVGTLRDHVAPWRSVYKIHLLTDTEVTFLLTSGGHNVGIVPDPSRDGLSYQVAVKGAHEAYDDPDAWAAKAPRKSGSWWPEWVAWLAAHSGALTDPPAMGAPEKGYAPDGAAPGTYVLRD